MNASMLARSAEETNDEAAAAAGALSVTRRNEPLVRGNTRRRL